MSPATCLAITAGNIERIITGPIVRQKGSTVIQQLADLLGHDRSDVCVCTKIGEELAKVCSKRKNKLKIRAERIEGKLVRIAPVAISKPNSSNSSASASPLQGLQEEIEERQRRRKRDEDDPQTAEQWTKFIATNQFPGLGHPVLEQAAR